MISGMRRTPAASVAVSAVPRQLLFCALARRGSHAAAELRVVQHAREPGPQRVGVSRRDEEAGLAVDDEVEQAADRGRDDRPPVRHRLRASDAEPFAARRARDHRGARVQRRELVMRDEAEGPGDPVAQRPVAGDDEPHPNGGRHELEHALLLARGDPRRAPRRHASFPTSAGRSTPLGITRASRAPSARASSASAVDGADHEPRPAHDRRASAASAARELDVCPPELEDERPPGRERDGPDGSQCACTRSASRAAVRAARREAAGTRAARAPARGCARRLPTTPAP